jgi:TP901 family phage tail tape measure protein
VAFEERWNMPGASDVRAGGAWVELYLRDSKFASQLAAQEKRFQAFGQVASEMGNKLLKVSAALAAPFVAGTKSFADFEKQMAMVSTMLDNPAAYMERFKNGVRDLSIEFGEGTDVIAKGLYDLLSSGVAPAQAMQVLRTAMMAARGGMTDTATAVKGLVAIMNSYNIPAERISEVSDMMFQTVKRGVITFEEMGQYIGHVAAMANVAGISMDELGAAIATISRKTNPDEAITGLKNALSEFLSPSAEGAALARQFGIEMNTATLRSKGLYGVLQQLSKLTPEQISKIFPDLRGKTAIIQLLEDLPGLKADLDAMAKKARSAQEAFERMSNLTGTAIAKVWQSLKAVSDELGESLSPLIKEAGEWAMKSAKSFAEWVKEHRDLVVSAAKAAVWIGVVGGAIKLLGVTVGGVASTLGGFATALRVVGATLAAVTAHPIVALAAALAAATAIMYAYTKQTADLTDAMHRYTEEADAQRSVDQMRMQRLQQLAQKQALESAEMDEAKGYIGELTNRYGDLGWQLDELSKKLTGAAEAQENLNKAMRADAIREIRAEVVEHQKNVAELQKELQSFWMREFNVPERMRSVGLNASAEYAPDWTFFDSSEKIKAIEEKAKKEQDAIDKLIAREKQIRGGDLAALTGGPGDPGRAKRSTKESIAEKLAAGKASAEELAKYEAELKERIHKADLERIEDEAKRERQAIRDKYAKEWEERAKASGVSLDQAAGVNRVWEAMGGKIGPETPAFNRLAQQMTNARAAELGAVDVKRRRELDRDNRALEDELVKLRIQAAIPAGLGQDRMILDMERAAAVRDAREKGLDVGKVEEQYKLKDQLLNVRANADALGPVGTFSSRAAGMLGAGSTATRIEENTKRTADATEKLANHRGGFAWGA